MDKYQFILDGIIVTNPEGWKDLEFTAERDKSISGLLVLFTSKLRFSNDGYGLIKVKFDANYNDKISAIIQRFDGTTFITDFEGVILLSDVKFNLERKEVEVTVEDRSFQGAISNNKNIKSFLNAGFTKNGVQITPPTQVILDYFRVSDGNYIAGFADRTHTLLSDALDFLVRFMTDDVVKGIQSTYLTTASNFETALLYIVVGEEIRTGANTFIPNVSFAQIMEFLKRTHNLSFDFIEVNNEPVMRIENREFFFNTTNLTTIRNIKDLTQAVDKQRLFSHLEVGNNTFTEAGNCSPTTRFFTFRDEDYAIQGKSNIDKLLDLKTDFITDSNTIQDILDNNNDEFDEDIFIVAAFLNATQVKRFQDPSFCSNLFFYNQGLTNDQVILRQIDSVPGSVAKFLSADSTQCSIGLLADAPLFVQPTSPILVIVQTFSDERVNFRIEDPPFFDLGDNFNSLNNQHFYDIPLAGDYSFEFNFNMRFVADGLGHENITLTSFLRRQDLNFNILEKTDTIVL